MPFEVSLNVLRLFSCNCMMRIMNLHIHMYIHHALQAHSKFSHTYILERFNTTGFACRGDWLYIRMYDAFYELTHIICTMY